MKKYKQTGDITENLAPYFEAIQDKDRLKMLHTEQYYSKNYGINTFAVANLEKLKKSSKAERDKTIEGVPSYRILDNYIYQQLLEFVPPRVSDQ